MLLYIEKSITYFRATNIFCIMHRYINGNVHGKSEFDRWFLFLAQLLSARQIWGMVIIDYV